MFSLSIRISIVAAMFALTTQSCLADEASQKALTEALSKFTLPEMPAELKQKLRDFVPNDLRQRSKEGNARSTAEWEKIKSREEWEAFRRAKIKLLRDSLGQSFRKDAWQPPKMVAPAEVAGSIQGEGYRIDKLLYRSAYGQWISANLYVPQPAREKMPGFIISHAHHTPKEQGELQDMGVLWARAGCYVLVPDHLGHGERRQHPFKSKADYDKDFQVSRQDYYFRYDVNLQLNMAGESLMGCLALDLMTGVSLLHDLKGIDKDKIILLGAVAGGGDPCAVTAALDERITCAAPFNFGGPQPETRYPLPEGVDFNYGGGGGWESTRNLAYSYRDGTLPWVIVGSMAPRRLIYGHEFSWDREHDPVWQRFQKIYAWYDKADNLSFAHGHGTLTSKDPPGSHCTHIGKTHRKQMHEALAKWFDIKLPGGEESTDRHDAAELRCWTDELRAKLKPEPLMVTLRMRLDSAPPQTIPNTKIDRVVVQREWSSEEFDLGNATGRQYVLQGHGRMIPVVLLKPKINQSRVRPGVIVVSRAGKQEFVRQRADMIAALLDAGIDVALPDLYSSGLTGSGSDLGRRSGATGRASTLAMHGSDLIAEQAQDVKSTFNWLTGENWDYHEYRVALWADSLVPPHSGKFNDRIPRDDDGQLPRGPDPLPQLVALRVASQGEPTTVYVRSGIDSFSSALNSQLVLLPQDLIPLPGNQRPSIAWPDTLQSIRKLPDSDRIFTAFRSDQVVDCLNRLVEIKGGKPEDHDPKTAAAWFIRQFQAERK